MSIKQLLHRGKNALQSGCPSQYAMHFYLGNEASDADSMISTLCYSHFKSHTSSDGILHIPVSCVARSDLRLRRDVDLLLTRVGVNISELICIDDFSIEDFCKTVSTKVILMDQNGLPSKLESLSDSVIEILDHHHDRNLHNNVKSSMRNIAFDDVRGKPLVGSTCTLVYEEYEKIGIESMNDEIAILLLTVICLDTINMNEVAAIGTQRDRQAIETLASRFTEDTRDILYNMMKTAKVDINFWTNLTINETLRLDYKYLQTSDRSIGIGTSACLMPLRLLVQKEDFKSHMISQFENKSNNCLLYAILTFVVNDVEAQGNSPSLRDAQVRELCLVCRSNASTNNGEMMQKLVDSLLYENANRYQLEPIESIYIPYESYLPDLCVVAFRQHNLKATRKKIAPDLISFFDNYNSK